MKKLMMMKPRKLNSKICWKNNKKQKPKKKRIRLRVKLKRRRIKVKILKKTKKKMSSRNLMQEMVDKQKNIFGTRPWRKLLCMYLYLQVFQLSNLMLNWVLMIVKFLWRVNPMSQHSFKVNGVRKSRLRKVFGTLKETAKKVQWQSQLKNSREGIGGHPCFKVILKLILKKLNQKIQNWVI